MFCFETWFAQTNIKKCRRMKCALHSGPNRRTAELERIAGKAYGRNPAGETWPENSFKSGLFPKQVYLYGVLAPFKGLHPWAA